MTGSIEPFDFGVRFGAGFEVPFTEDMAFLFGADYDLGLSNINKDVSFTTARTRSLIASVGLGVQALNTPEHITWPPENFRGFSINVRLNHFCKKGGL